MTEEMATRLAATTAATLIEAGQMWVVKRALTNLTGRSFSWKDIYLLAFTTRIAGAWLEVGRRSEDAIHDRLREIGSV